MLTNRYEFFRRLIQLEKDNEDQFRELTQVIIWLIDILSKDETLSVQDAATQLLGSIGEYGSQIDQAEELIRKLIEIIEENNSSDPS